MAVSVVVLAHVAMVTLLMGESGAAPGTWEYIQISDGETYDFSNIGWFPKSRRSLIFGVQACQEVILTLNGKSGTNYIMAYLGYATNQYALVIPSSDCDATGSCSITNFATGSYLDCSNFMFFWMTWDVDGSFQIGTDYYPGQNTIITLPGTGLFEEALFMTVTVNDVSGASIYLFIDDEPEFLDPAPDGSTDITIQETSVNATVLYTIQTKDPENDPVTGFIQEDTDLFQFSGNDLINLQPLDYETNCIYVVTLSIHDQANVVNTTLTIRLQNVYDEAPSVDSTSMMMPEELAVGSYIDGGYTVNDIDDGDQLAYTLSGSHAAYFQLTSDGRLKVAARIDFDQPNSITLLDQLTLTVTDLGGNTNSTTLTFTVTDVNDIKPTFSQPVYTAEVAEGAGTISLLQLTVTDDDSGVRGEYDVTMSGDDPSDPKFTLDAATLELSVDANKLDYESLETEGFMYSLTFVATDRAADFQPLSGTAVAVVKILPVNEFTPVWTTPPADTTVSETRNPGSTLGQYTATDDDLSKDGVVKYEITNVQDDMGAQHLDLFHLDSGNGDFILASQLDYDTATGGAAYYDVTLKAVDGGTSPKSVETTFRITVGPENDNHPVFADSLYQTVVPEDVSIGTLMFAMVATDADGDALTYSIEGEGQGTFAYVTDLTNVKKLDYEDHRCYTFKLKASDGVHETEVPVNINVSNVIDETPVLTVNSPLTLIEELPAGTPLGGVYDVTDRDADDTLTFSLEGTESSYFTIDSSTGVISVAQRIDRDAGVTSITQVTLKVTDAGGNTASGTLTFSIIDINDNSPQFSSDVIYVDLTENTAVDTILKTFVVADADDGANADVVVSIIDGDDANPNEKFKMAGLDLKTHATPVNYEDLGADKFQYTLSVQAVDQPTTEAAKTSVAVVVVTVLPVNEHIPVWTNTPADISVSESFKTGSAIIRYTATDDDLGIDGDVTYELVQVFDNTGLNGSDKFHLDSGNGNLILSSSLDADTATGGADYYDVTVKAVDGGASPKSVETTFKVSVGGVNDNPPIFNKTLYQAVVSEDVSISTVMLVATATDADGDSVSYTISGEGLGTFDHVTDLINTVLLDYEEHSCYTFKLIATDGVHQTEVPLNINVSNVIDEIPILTVFSPLTLIEELPIGTPLGGVYNATDRDEDDTLTYSLEGTESSYFTIDSSTGVISVAQRIDRDAGVTSITQVTLKVTDAGGNTASGTLSFTIIDINDNSPHFSSDIIYVNVTENTAADQAILTLTCTDADDGDNAVINVAIKSGDATPARFKLLGMDLQTTTQAVNYEDPDVSRNMYSLTLTVTDSPTAGSPHTAIATVIVSILPENEFTPVFTAPVATGTTLSETTQTGYLVGTFIATDDDNGDDGKLLYEITSVTDPTGTSSTSKFLIDEISGKLRVAEALDFDVATGGVVYYDITVKTTDKGSPSKSETKIFKVTLQNENDIAPVFLGFSSVIDVPENTNVGDVIMTLTTQDDDGDTVTAAIVDGDISVFSASGADIILQQALDYEASAGHMIVISITDGIHTVNNTLAVRVTDVIDEIPILETFSPVYVTEELPVGTEVDGLYHVTDLDRGDSFTFTLSGSHSSYFSINSTSGQIKISQRIDLEALSGNNILDQLTLTVKDNAGLQATAALSVEILDINDAYPIFSQSVYKVNISESSSTEVLLDLVCTDADSGTNGDISMQITDGDDPVSSKFQLTGTQLSALGADLDYEALEATQYMFILTVAANDAPQNESPKTGVTLVVVSVLPVNEHTPVWEASLSVSGGAFPDLTMLENVTVGSELLSLKATDDDHGPDGVVSYQISSVTTNTGTSTPELFSVDSTSGALRIARQLDRDITSGNMFYTLVLIARDGGNPSKETSATLKISLGNVNDNVPIFSTNDYLIEVPETTAVGTTIHTFTSASDVDGDTITYTVVGGAGAVFGISGLNVKTLVALDFETERCYSLIIEASDGLYSASIAMTVMVKDAIDEQPVIVAHNPIIIPEEVPVGTRITWAINVTDEDKGDVLLYSMTGTDVGFFNLDPDTGELTTTQRLDRETKSTLDDLTLRVKDNGGLSDDIVLSIILVDINDETPEFSQDVHVVYVVEGGVEVDLVTLQVADHDLGDNANYDVTITSGNSGSEFRLDGMTLKGDTSMMDYESGTISNYTYVVAVQAVDKPTNGASRTGETIVVVHVGPLNEFTPVWVSPTPTANVFPDITVSESSTPMTTSVMTYSASDDDSGEHGKITFSIVSATTGTGDDATGVFLLNPEDGTLWMLKEPDADIATGGTSSYDVIIMAEDGGHSSIQATQTVHISNTNENPPTIWTPIYSTEVAESIAIGSAVFSLNVNDIDGDSLTATVVQGGDYFDYDGTSVVTKNDLDFENQRCHTIVISVSDGVHDVNVTLAVNVTDVNDNSPEVTVHSSVSIPEELPVSTIIGGVFDVTDRDEGDILTFSLSGADVQFVEIDTVSGELKVKSRIDRDGGTGVTSLDDLTLTVTDSAGQNTVVSINITVLDVNDNSPVCLQAVFVINVTENSTDGIVAQLSCSDEDSGDNGVFVLSIINGNDLGYISLVNLDVHATGSTIDYDTMDTSVPYIVSLSAVDQPTTEAAKSATISLIIQVLPQNEHSPVWKSPIVDATRTFPATSLSEITPAGSVIVNVTATDVDAGIDGDITYDIVSAIDDIGNDRSSLFMLDQSEGILRTKGLLDSDPPVGMSKVILVIRASDGGVVAKSTTATLLIDVTAANDNPPVFTDMPTEVDVLEDAATGTVALNLQANDIDGDSVDFELSGSESHLFQIVGSTLKLYQNLDFEAKQCHSLLLTARDGVHSTNVSVTINVLNVVDESPEVTLSTPLLLPEELPVGMTVGGFLSVSDQDVGDNLTYSLTGTGAQYFQMNSTGEISIAKRIDRDSPGDVTFIDGLTLTVTDSAGLSDAVTLNFTIVDINDNVPVCAVTSSEVTVTENTNQDVLLSELTCTDHDGGNYGSVTMTLDTASDPNGHFKLSGTQLKTDANPVNYETAADVDYMYNIRVFVEDNPGGVIQLTAISVITIKILPVNEDSPQFLTPSVDMAGNFNDVSVLENTTIGTTIATFNATDDDHGEDGDVIYSVSSATTDSGLNAPGLFTIDSSTGELRVSGLLDADVVTGGVNFYMINITAMDSGSTPLSTQGAMRVLVTGTNDNSPEWNVTLLEVEVYENASVGDEVFSLAVTDVDGDVITFTTSDTMFEIDGSKVKVKQQLDYEQERCHTITISASDGKYTVNKTLTVHTLDSNDESPVVTVTNAMSVPEELPVGTIIARSYMVTDKDENDNLSYSFSGSGSGYLTIDSMSGALSIASRLDRDSPSNVMYVDDVTLTVTDSVGHQTSVSLNITVTDINDNPPICSVTSGLLNITENTASDTILSEIACSDIDSGNFGNVNLTIDSSSDPGKYFRLSGNQLLTGSNAVDYEMAADMNYILGVHILAVDNPGGDTRLTSTLVLSVKVLPENEQTPQFVSPTTDGSGQFPDITLAEDITVGTVVASFNATDGDHGEDGVVIYTIIATTSDSGVNVPGLFTIDSSTGELRVSGLLDADVVTGGVNFYMINITAMDSGSTPLSTQGAMRVLVTGTNDNSPEWNVTLLEMEVYENASVGDEVFSLAVTDVDGDVITFTTSDTMFEIDGSKVKVKQLLDYEQERCHTITISASDGKYTVNKTLTVHTLDSNDESPVVTVTNAMSVPEELPVGTIIARSYKVTDKDENDNLSYSFSGSGSGYFTIDSVSGALSIASRLDRDSPSNVMYVDDVTLTVTDSVGHQTSVSLNITVTDINDNPPICSVTSGQLNIIENTASDIILSEIACSDIDSGNFGNVNLTIDSSSDPGKYFRLSGNQLLTGSNAVDYEMAADMNYMLGVHIVAVDNPGGDTRLTSTLVLSVKVLPENEHTPQFVSPTTDGSGQFPDITLAEDITVGTVVASFNATDGDHGEDGVVIYTIIATTSDSGVNVPGLFTIDSSTGELRVSGLLDADVVTGGVNFYIINITAMDSGSTPLSTQGAMRVLVTGTNDNPPEWNVTLLEVEVYENASVGDEVFSLAVTDVDGDVITFTTFDTMFEIDGSKVKVKQQLDYEQERCHTITVSSSDGKYTVNKTVAIQVLDSNDESPVVTVTMALSVPEELPVGTGVARGYSITDRDDNDVLSYALEGTENSLLTINSSTGEITVKERIDFESLSNPGNLDIKLRVTDSGGHTVVHPLNLAVTDVNDNAPVFSKAVQSVTVAENAVGETLLLTLTCTDADNGNNGNFSFNISEGNNDGLFRLDGDDLYVQVVDYEATESLGFMYSLTIIAVDHGVKPKTAATVVVVEIHPVNEFDPVWQTPAVDGSGHFPDITLSESVLPGHDVITVTATDQDLGEDGHVTYSIYTIVSDAGVNADSMFTISPVTGVLSTSSQLDIDQSTGGANYYDVTIRVSDRGNQSRSATAIQRVLVDNYNDIMPVFTETLFKVNVACDDPPGKTLGKISADDEDGPNVEYEIESGSNAYVSVDSSGDVLLHTRPVGNSVTDLAQSISIVASDKGTPELKVLGQLLVLYETCGNVTSCENVTTTQSTTSTTSSTTETTTASTSETTQEPTTHANCTTPAPCKCNTTIVAGPPFEDVVEAWAMRAAVMGLALGLLGVVVWYFRQRIPGKPSSLPNKVYPKENTLERGIGDDSGRRFDDLEHHILHK